MRGDLSEQISGEFCRDFFGIFRSFFSWKNQEKNLPQNSQQISNQNLGASRPTSTLQRSDLDLLMSVGADLLKFLLLAGWVQNFAVTFFLLVIFYFSTV